jgi:hypothetical protein
MKRYPSMSLCFRPVKEIWNTHSCFVEPKALITLLHDLAGRVGIASDELSHGENTAVWFEDGTKILDYIQSDRRFNALSFKDSLEEQGMIVDEDTLFPLLANMQSLSEQWRDSVGGHGELVFYVDNY